MIHEETSILKAEPDKGLEESLPPQERLVRALENPAWIWHTVDGLVRGTGLSQQEVLALLEAMPDTVMAFHKGKPIYTTRRHYKQKRGLWHRYVDAVTNSLA